MNLEDKCRRAVIKMADHVKDINYKLSNFLDNYRHDYYDCMGAKSYLNTLKRPPKNP